jgi:hypothetical protein
LIDSGMNRSGMFGVRPEARSLAAYLFGGPNRCAEIDQAIEKIDQHLNA